MFRAPAMLLPHESTVAHEQRFIMDAPMISRTRSRTTLGSISSESVQNKLNDETVVKDVQVSLRSWLLYLKFFSTTVEYIGILKLKNYIRKSSVADWCAYSKIMYIAI